MILPRKSPLASQAVPRGSLNEHPVALPTLFIMLVPQSISYMCTRTRGPHGETYGECIYLQIWASCSRYRLVMHTRVWNHQICPQQQHYIYICIFCMCSTIKSVQPNMLCTGCSNTSIVKKPYTATHNDAMHTYRLLHALTVKTTLGSMQSPAWQQFPALQTTCYALLKLHCTIRDGLNMYSDLLLLEIH